MLTTEKREEIKKRKLDDVKWIFDSDELKCKLCFLNHNALDKLVTLPKCTKPHFHSCFDELLPEIRGIIWSFFGLGWFIRNVKTCEDLHLYEYLSGFNPVKWGWNENQMGTCFRCFMCNNFFESNEYGLFKQNYSLSKELWRESGDWYMKGYAKDIMKKYRLTYAQGFDTKRI
jgi:hypothetical protein